MSELSVVLDTNIIISGLRSRNGASFQILKNIGSERFKIQLSVPLVLEYEAVLKRNIDVFGLKLSDIDDFLNYLCSTAELHEIFYLWRPILSDSKDDMVLELAVVSNADYLITYNKADFKNSHLFGIKVIDGREFIRELNL
ncbi:MAG: putative toxin-antitoxin system toxin component, PIN family [bacterium]|nr:putative toxin-antitoxin system toxin component, PIN family [bacterium]